MSETRKRPKSIRVPKESKATAYGPITPMSNNLLLAATLGNSIKRLLASHNVGYILITIDEEGAAMATSEPADEAVNILSHFAQDARLLENGLKVMECPCSHCEAFRRGESNHGTKH